MSVRWSQKWSLQTRILLLIIVISASVLGVAEWFTTLSSVRAIENGVGKQAANVARRLASDLGSVPSARFPVEYQNRVSEILELEPNVIRVDVFNESDGVLKLVQTSSTRGDRPVVSQEISAFRDNRADTFALQEGPTTNILSTYPLVFRNGQKGFVTVMSSLWAVNDILTAHLRIRLCSLLATMVLLVGAIVWVFRTTVYGSVQHLVDVMNRFKSGEVSARADENLPADFGELARHFNRMLEEIQGFNAHLNQQVEAATLELTTRNSQLQTLNTKLYEIQKRLTQAERLALVGQLTATFAHEVGSPLSAISTHLQMLLEDSILDSKVRERLCLANGQIDRVCGIVESLLKSTRQPVRKLTFELDEIVQKVIHLLQPTFESRGITFGLRANNGPFLVEGDPDQLQQLFLNLFNNSLDAITGSGSLSVEIRRQPYNGRSYRSYLEIVVRDSGFGIPTDRLDHIFEPLFTTKEFGKGTGLGLAVSKGIVQQHGGQISVTSALGKGACFTIRLPEAQKTGQKIPPKLAVSEVLKG